ncbi:hypothetical protein VP01_779g5 [Puccinia sorghi]|uniref:Uncharacterized protein n=1 Tax=Puccinia sorghi TaxID=27349 RepID=A0A0L6UB78_9BASI|nr:hypothetical protein VP01_779g5 [Puccinia sorghi]
MEQVLVQIIFKNYSVMSVVCGCFVANSKNDTPTNETRNAQDSLATPEVRGIAGSNTAPIAKRKIGENKLLVESTSKNRYTPYASSASSSSKPNQPPHSLIGRCLTCKANVARPSAKYCQACACFLTDLGALSIPLNKITMAIYANGLCAMCGKIVIDVTYSQQCSK